MIPTAITRLQANIKQAVNPAKLMEILFRDEGFRELIVELNTKDQLFEQGIDSEGRSLGEYSIYTKAIKSEKGQRTDHITLKDTGEFYNSFKIVFENGALRIVADGQKEDTNLFQEFGIDIVGLTGESMNKAIAAAKPILLYHIRRQLHA